MSGRIGDLSPAQEHVLSKFKNRIQDIRKESYDDHYLLKWLRARNFDLDKAEIMLRKNLLWRKQNDVDNILKNWTPPEVLAIYYPGGLFGHTKEGLPIWIEPAGNMDPKGLLYSCKKSDIIKLKIYHCELIQTELEHQSKKLGRRIDNIISICDFQHYGLKHMWGPAIDIFKEVLHIFEPHYPETVRKNYIINVNRFFSIIFNIAKPFLSEDTKSKVTMLGSNYKLELLKEIDADQLPVRWGGTATDPDGDPSCRSRIALGGVVPEKYRIHKEDIIDDSFTKCTVARGGRLEIDYTSTEPHSVLAYQFSTENHDIGFCIYYRTSDEKQRLQDMEQILTHQRVNSHMVLEDGCCKLTRPGTYVVVFDNSFSWLNSKKVEYKIQVLPPYDLVDLNRSDSFVVPEDDILECTHL